MASCVRENKSNNCLIQFLIKYTQRQLSQQQQQQQRQRQRQQDLMHFKDTSMEEIVADLGFQEMVKAAERRRVGEVLEIHGGRRSWRGEKEEGAG